MGAGNIPVVTCSGQAHSNAPAECPRARALIDPTAPSSASTTPSRSRNSLTAAMPETAVNDASGAPIRTCCLTCLLPRTLLTR